MAWRCATDHRLAAHILRVLTEARQAGFERERTRLAAGLGAEHTRVAALAHRLVAGAARQDATSTGVPSGSAAHIRIIDASPTVLYQRTDAVSVSPGDVEY
jgi:hypothetical protein